MGQQGRPVLELLVGPRIPAGVDRVLVAAARSCTPRVPGGAPAAAARLATSLDAVGLRAALDDPSTPLAVVLDRPPGGPLGDDVFARADVLLAPAGLTASLPDRRRATAVLGLPEVDPERHRPVPPFVRAGWRRLLDFPDHLVIHLGYAPETQVGPRTTATVLALASAAAVRGEHTALALALGTPVVTDAESATRLGATDGEHLVVAAGDVAPARAAELARDADRCARLSRCARDLVERRHDPETVAGALLAGLGLHHAAPGAGSGSAAVLYSACRELGLPTDGSLYGHRLLMAPRMERTPR
jgi:hypothetical protein